MAYDNTVWAALERWSPITFLSAGGLFALFAALEAFRAVTGTGMAVSPRMIFTCLLVVFVGVLGLYPRLAERDSTLALSGISLLAVTAVIIISTFGLSALVTGPTLGKLAIVATIMSVVTGSMLTFITFGLASLRTGAHSRLVGGFLLVMGASTAFVVVAMIVYSNPAPAWVGFVANALFATSLGSIGYVLRTEDLPADTADSAGDVTAG